MPIRNAITMTAKIITMIPSHILAILDCLLTMRSLITLSIPTISNRIPIIRTIDTIAVPGNASIKIDRIIAIAPSPI